MTKDEAIKELWNTDPEYRKTVSNAIKYSLKGYIKYRDLRIHAEKKVSRRWHKKKWETLLDDYRYHERKSLEIAAKWIAAIRSNDKDKVREIITRNPKEILSKFDFGDQDIEACNPEREN